MKVKKGQAAMEFLMTYGWAILVVLIVIGALAYFGVLNPQQFLPKKCQFSQGIVCQDHIITSSNTGKIRINNGLGNDIQLGGFNFTSDGGINCTASPTNIMTAGSSADIDLICSNADKMAGARIRGTMILAYTDLQTQFDHTVTGTMLTDVE